MTDSARTMFLSAEAAAWEPSVALDFGASETSAWSPELLGTPVPDSQTAAPDCGAGRVNVANRKRRVPRALWRWTVNLVTRATKRRAPE